MSKLFLLDSWKTCGTSSAKFKEEMEYFIGHTKNLHLQTANKAVFKYVMKKKTQEGEEFRMMEVDDAFLLAFENSLEHIKKGESVFPAPHLSRAIFKEGKNDGILTVNKKLFEEAAESPGFLFSIENERYFISREAMTSLSEISCIKGESINHPSLSRVFHLAGDIYRRNKAFTIVYRELEKEKKIFYISPKKSGIRVPVNVQELVEKGDCKLKLITYSITNFLTEAIYEIEGFSLQNGYRAGIRILDSDTGDSSFHSQAIALRNNGYLILDDKYIKAGKNLTEETMLEYINSCCAPSVFEAFESAYTEAKKAFVMNGEKDLTRYVPALSKRRAKEIFKNPYLETRLTGPDGYEAFLSLLELVRDQGMSIDKTTAESIRKETYRALVILKNM